MDGDDDHMQLLIHDSFAVGAILPRTEGRGLPRILVNQDGVRLLNSGALSWPLKIGG